MLQIGKIRVDLNELKHLTNADKSRLTNVFQYLNLLGIRFPVAEISRRMKVDSGNVSNYLNGIKPISDNFYTDFLKEFSLDEEIVATNEVKESSETYQAKRRDQKNKITEFRAPLVTVKARAGYVSSYDNVDIVEGLEKYAIPPGVTYTGATFSS